MTPIIHDLDQEPVNDLTVKTKNIEPPESDYEFSIDFMIDLNGPTGYGDKCYSDADPGL